MSAFEKAGKLKEEGIRVAAASSDTLEKARQSVEEWGVTFPLGYGLDPAATAEKTGAFYDANQKIIHSTGFVLRPNNTVAVAAYSTGPIGRLMWQDVLALVQFYKKQG
ncbi:MAG: hypothetical protein HYY21_05430 [Candidatus Tectomicrobia bacterium]|nr:hypothetical protein [Candidatus Tectomicrobia bacterium]